MHRIEEPSLDSLAARARVRFVERFGREAKWVVAAPGRVNLIGEHTDYNGGFVLPMAIDRYVVIAAAAATGNQAHTIQCYSSALDDMAVFEPSTVLTPAEPRWANYVRGVMAEVMRQGIAVPGFDCVIENNVPLGGGLSSSAALEVATATLLEAITGKTLDPLTKARLCQNAEHDFAGMPCGIMDQFTSVMGQRGAALLIDCRAETAIPVPLDDSQVAILIVNSNVHHTLVGSPYAERRSQCQTAAQALGVAQLRDVSSHRLEAFRDRLEPTIYRRARHVVTEIERTQTAAAMLAERNWPIAGQLMVESHASMRDDFEISCPELDLLVDLAKLVGPSGGLFGSRMTGGGFGGCTVSLVRADAVKKIAETITGEYQRNTGIIPSWFATTPAAGARQLSGPSLSLFFETAT